MLHSSLHSKSSVRSRAQTEPIAALVAIALVCSGIVLYAGVLADIYPGGTDRDPADATLEQVWNSVGTDGVYRETRDRSELHQGVRLPEGYTAFITVTTVTDDGRSLTVDSVFVDRSIGVQYDASEIDRPDDTASASRSIGVHVEPAPAGDVRGGTLHVEVWKG
ncbi:hypothetical protein EA462_02620 [Natrarchaeobius halalkaliphilus]|uniref:Uncharacterized protein n=1 Tax=Natrarchaeobius halalkaliphilus TaxID=1679091 RepID=A0A3N6LWA7_9EURY|nr:hypothetical protein [Natrarchaeobius halalkaliphilus]RQG93117.1 hypothetical protein EA462_02620 [Natrarchaeobius halalkaliphilus]